MASNFNALLNSYLKQKEDTSAMAAKQALMDQLRAQEQAQQNISHTHTYGSGGLTGGIGGAGGSWTGGAGIGTGIGAAAPTQWINPNQPLTNPTYSPSWVPAMPSPTGILTTIYLKDAHGQAHQITIDSAFAQMIYAINAFSGGHALGGPLSGAPMPTSGDFSEDEMDLAGQVMAEMESKKERVSHA